MATQEHVNVLQAQLLAAETGLKNAVRDIRDAVNQEPGIPDSHANLLRVSAEAVRHSIGMFHHAAALCSVSVGIHPLSGGQDKQPEGN